MNPDLLLGIAAALVGFFLKTTLAFGVCLVLSRLADSPNRRFAIWLTFLYGSTAYWLWIAKDFRPGNSLPTSTSRVSVQPVALAVNALHIPDSWASPAGLAFRLIGIAYLLVLTCMLIAQARKQRHLRWVLRFTTTPSIEIQMIFESLAERLHAGRSRLLVLSGISSPATFGWIRPIILLPDLCLQRDPSELEDILRHELHHVRRRDFVWNGVAVLCRSVLFFHPAAWYAVRRMQFDRELACDLAVISDSPGRRAEYAECLIHVARLNSSKDAAAWGIDFAASAEHLKSRVHSILAGSRKPSRWLLGLRVACGLTLVVGFLGVVPSVAIFVSYTHQAITQPPTSVTVPTHLAARPMRAARIHRLSHPFAPASGDAAVASVSGQTGANQSMATASADRKSDGVPSTQDRSGPQLLHRPSPSSANSVAPDINGAKQQTAILIDPDDSGQIGKGGDRDKKQSLQQAVSAAAALYKQLGALDRH